MPGPCCLMLGEKRKKKAGQPRRRQKKRSPQVKTLDRENKNGFPCKKRKSHRPEISRENTHCKSSLAFSMNDPTAPIASRIKDISHSISFSPIIYFKVVNIKSIIGFNYLMILLSTDSHANYTWCDSNYLLNSHRKCERVLEKLHLFSP